MISDPAKFAVTLPELSPGERLKTIILQSGMDVRLAARLAGLDPAGMKRLNAAYRRNRMVVFGGGHGDYAGNEIMVFDIETLRWIRINDPSPRFDSEGVIERSGYYPDANGYPDLQQPRSRHSYWSQIYVPTIDRYCAIGSSYTFPRGLGAPMKSHGSGGGPGLAG